MEGTPVMTGMQLVYYTEYDGKLQAGFFGPLGGGEWQPAMAGPMHPPFSLFAKRENAPCTVEERKTMGRAE